MPVVDTVPQLAARLAALAPNPRIVVSGNAAWPTEAVRLIDENVASYTLHALNATGAVPTRAGVIAETCFVGVGMRRHPRLRYVPCRLSLVPRLFATTLAPDVVVVHSAPARRRRLSLGIEVNVLPAAIEACRARGGLVVAVVNPAMPYTFGDAELEDHLVDVVVEIGAELPQPGPVVLDEAALTIGERVAADIADGSTLQLGIGAVPDATLASLQGKQGLRIWSEMFSDGVLGLDRLGVLDPAHPLTSSFCVGGPDLYGWLDGNCRVQMMRSETVNDPGVIAQQRLMASINTALEVDLFGQANASRINARIHSGFGGQTDFIVGALHARGGQAFMALRSWHPRANVSTVVALLDEPVTSMQQSAIVTEQGLARLWGRDEKTQAANIITRAAHPQVRAELWEEAAALGLS